MILPASQALQHLKCTAQGKEVPKMHIDTWGLNHCAKPITLLCRCMQQLTRMDPEEDLPETVYTACFSPTIKVFVK